MADTNLLIGDAWSDIRLLNVKMVVDYLLCSSANVLVLTESGQIPKPVDVGCRMMRWRRSDLDTWLEETIRPA